MRCSLLGMSLLLLGCGDNFDDNSSRVRGLRLLGVQGQPAEAGPGASVTLTAVAVDPGGRAITARWAACTEPPIPGTGLPNPACVSSDTAPYLIPLGEGLSITAQVPAVDPAVLGAPDPTGGVYLPVRLRLATASESLEGIYRLRYAQGAPPNQNPRLADVSLITRAADGSVTASPLVESEPLVVHEGDALTLRATFAQDSAETYEAPGVGGTTRTTKETLNVTWFTTAGRYRTDSTGDGVETVLRLNRDLPARGQTIDLWLIGRDERGGLDFLHRTLELQ
ncbi:MAG TPA: hypothetical protein VH877_18865 [Polyangia bacterium]|nr:hypothetical protein [Polyangia bacterium]